MLEDKPVVLVEAKPFDEILLEDHSSQIISYGKVEDIQWVALTNGRMLKVFDTKAGKTEKECLVIKVDLEKLPQQVNELKMISRESILTGEIDRTAKQLAKTRTVIRLLKQKQQELIEKFTAILLKITGSELEHRVKIVSSQLAQQAIQLFIQKVESPIRYERKGEISKSEISIGEIPTINRRELSLKPSGEVIICPSKVQGVEFLTKYNAWGFVNISKHRRPEYFALYVGRPFSSVLYFGEIDSITKPLESKKELEKIREEDTRLFETGKRVIHLKPGSLVKFKDPIPLKSGKMAPRSLRYTKLDKIVKKSFFEDL